MEAAMNLSAKSAIRTYQTLRSTAAPAIVASMISIIIVAG